MQSQEFYIPSSGIGSKSIATPYAPIQFNIPKAQPKPIVQTPALLYGVGIDDCPDSLKTERAYISWSDMLERAYCPVFHAQFQTYKDCSVVEEWRRYSNYAKWHTENMPFGYQLDKDILIPGNKLYSPSTVLAVTPELNRSVVFFRRVPMSGYYGVHSVPDGFFRAECKVNGKRLKGPYRFSAAECHKDWQLMKADSVEALLLDYMKGPIDLRVVRAILAFVDRLRIGAAQGTPTTSYGG